MKDLFLYGFALGLLFNAIPGAIFVASLKRGVQGGFFPAFMIQIGSLLGDFIWAVLGLSGAAFLFTFDFIEISLSIAGVVLLGWLALNCFKDATSSVPVLDDSIGFNDKSDIMIGASLSLSNPVNISYWVGLAGTVSALGVQESDGVTFTIFLTGFMVSSVVWCFLCAGCIAILQKMMNRFLWILINVCCGIGLTYFALRVLLHLS